MVRIGDFFTVSVLYRNGVAPAIIDVPHPDDTVPTVHGFYIAARIGLYIVGISIPIIVVPDTYQIPISIIGITELPTIVAFLIYQPPVLIPVPVFFPVNGFTGTQPT